jgi:hypothetical protein
VIIENSASLLGVLDQLPGRPELWQQLKTDYRQTTYAAYSGLTELPAALAELPVFLDGQGNPYGTIYLSAGERVAQMVLARFLQADFIPHDRPEASGQDRGGADSARPGGAERQPGHRSGRNLCFNRPGRNLCVMTDAGDL